MLMPKNRGRYPLYGLYSWFFETGWTFFFMDKGADSGDVPFKKNHYKTKDNVIHCIKITWLL